MQRRDILYAGSLYNIPEYKNNPRRYSRYHIKLDKNGEYRSRMNSGNDANEIILDGEAFDPEETICCLSAEASKGLVQMLDIGK